MWFFVLSAVTQFRPVPWGQKHSICPNTFRPDEGRCSARILAVVTCYSPSDPVETALRSIDSQACDKTILLMDDNPSTVCTKNVRSLIRKKNRPISTQIHFHTVMQNEGLAATRNRAIEIAKEKQFDWMVFLDADDSFAPHFFSEGAKMFPQSDIVTSNQLLISPANKHAIIWNVSTNHTVSDLKKQGPFPVPNFLRVAFLRHGFPVEMIFGREDYVFWVDAIRRGARISKVDAVGSCYTVADNSMMRSPDYITFAESMFVSRSAALFSTADVCAAVRVLRTLSSSDHGRLLERAVVQQPVQCTGWFWLGLWKLRHGCARDLKFMLPHALKRCAESVQRGSDTRDNLAQLLLLEFPRTSTNHCHDMYMHQRRRDLLPKLLSTPDAPPYSGYANVRGEILPPRVTLQCPTPRAPRAKTRRIPNVIHFTYNMGREPLYFPFVPYVNVLTALMIQNPTKVFIHVIRTPYGPYWTKITQLDSVKVIKWPDLFETDGGRCLVHHSHKSDVYRLKILQEYGGIYLDMDVTMLRPIPDAYFTSAETVLARQYPPAYSWRNGSAYHGLCNAFIMSRPRSRFLEAWLRTYDVFRSYGHDEYWDEHSVMIPAQMVDTCPEWERSGAIFVEKGAQFFEPSWHNVSELYARDGHIRSIRDVRRKYPNILFHLWGSVSGDIEDLNQLSERVGCDTPWGALVCELLRARTFINARKRA